MAEARATKGGNLNYGIAGAVLLHVAIIGLLSVQWTSGERRFDNPPMEVDLIAETAPVSTAPVIADTPPAARLGDPDAFVDPPPEPVVTPPAPTPRVTPSPPPKQVQRPVKTSPPKAPAKTATPPRKLPPRTKGNLDGIIDGLAKDPPPKAPPKAGAPAGQTAAEVRKSIDVSIKSAVAARWNGCRVSGVDVDQLKTVVKFRLTASGALAGFTSVATSGENDSNKFQIQRHQECAKRAIELAAPFDLPEENFSFWQNYTLDFIKR